jgi:hypothetical protein
VRSLEVDAQILELLPEPVDVVQLLEAVAGVVVVDGADDGQPGEGLGQVERAALVLEHLGAQRLARRVAQQALGEVHQAAVVRVGLVELHHGEFGVVARAEALVAEVAVDLEHLLEAADHQALEVQLRARCAGTAPCPARCGGW